MCIRDSPEQWLIRSKIAWSRRHESKRASSHARVEVPSLAAPASRAAGGQGAGGGRSTSNSARAGKLPANARSAPGRSTVSLKMLVDAGAMTPGPDAVWISYLHQTWSGELTSQGDISFRGVTYQSPSAWAIFCKRIANPSKKADLSLIHI